MKYLIILFTLVLFTSCDMSRKTFDNSEELTTVELQNQPKDTVIISVVDDKYVYVFNSENLVVDRYRIEVVNSTYANTVSLIFSLFCIVAIVIIIYYIIFD